MNLVSNFALVSEGATLGENVEIGPYTIVHNNVQIGDNVKIGSYCELGVRTPLGTGSPLVIQDKSIIRSHSVFYESSTFGVGLITGHHVTVRENTLAGCSFQIGSYSELQGDCMIGDHVRFQSNIFVGKKTKIGNFVWVFPYVIFTNDPTPPSNLLIGCVVGDYAAIGAASVILPGVTIGSRSFVGAASCLTKDLPEGMFAVGSPAIIKGEASQISLPNSDGQSAYPWTNHFYRGYPAEVVDLWKREARGVK
jgi:acetyltransferase-like isoleucine patch superfamily enzyme